MTPQPTSKAVFHPNQKIKKNPFTAIIFHYFQINTNKDILTVIISK